MTGKKTPKPLTQFTKREALSLSESRTVSVLPNSEYLFPATCGPHYHGEHVCKQHCSRSAPSVPPRMLTWSYTVSLTKCGSGSARVLKSQKGTLSCFPIRRIASLLM